MLHQVLLYVATRPLAFFASLMLVRVVINTFFELRGPARDVPYRQVWWRDAIAAAIFAFVVLPASTYADRVLLPIRPDLAPGLAALPIAALFVAYLVLSDFGQYWVHRLLHTHYLWRAHKWHHSPTYMYWLAGVRGSILQQTLVNVPYVFAGVLLDVAPWWMTIIIVLKNTAENDLMHLNVSWGSNRLEWFVVTPRYHHVHHSDNPEHYRGNLATLFPIWDRLFGTYVRPDAVQHPISFGIGEQVPTVRLIVGV